MDFGFLDYKDFEKNVFTLPKPVLHFNPTKDCTNKLHIGLPKWGRKEWVGEGRLYPKGTQDVQFLNLYVHHFNTIELNATHYKINTAADVMKWADKATGLYFKFCPKMPQLISHYSQFKNTEFLTDSFLEGIMAFGEQLGPIFLQVSDKYQPSRRAPLFDYLKSFPKDLTLFLEVRHPDWFSDKAVFEELLSVLKANGQGLVLTDSPGRRDVLHMQFILPKIFLRFLMSGNSETHTLDMYRLEQWKEIIQTPGFEETYFFVHSHNEVEGPSIAKYLQTYFEEK